MAAAPRTAVVLAGGLGTRLRAAVPDLPKPMAPVAGRPFLEHLLDFWIAAGIARVVLSVGYRSAAIVDHFGNVHRGVPIDYAVETTPLGTGGGVVAALRGLDRDADVLLLNGDTFFDLDPAAFFAFHAERRAEMSAALFFAEEAGRYGRARFDDAWRLDALSADKAAVGDAANGGIYLLSPGLLAPWLDRPDAPSSFEADIVPALFAAGRRIFGRPFPGRFIDIGVPGDYRRATDLVTGAATPDTE